MKICVVLCVKNEGLFVLKWVAHLQAVGMTDILIYTYL